MVLRRDSGIQKFMCEEHFHWGMAPIYILTTDDSVRKDDVVAFKSRRNKRLLNNED